MERQRRQAASEDSEDLHSRQRPHACPSGARDLGPESRASRCRSELGRVCNRELDRRSRRAKNAVLLSNRGRCRSGSTVRTRRRSRDDDRNQALNGADAIEGLSLCAGGSESEGGLPSACRQRFMAGREGRDSDFADRAHGTAGVIGMTLSAGESGARMNYDFLVNLRRNHPAWRLLAADLAPLVIGFLHHAFVRPNVRALAEQEASSQLDDYLHHLRERLGEQAPSRAARDYLAEWADNAHGWLRRYYPPDSDEPHYDLTPAAERAIHWLAGLE